MADFTITDADAHYLEVIDELRPYMDDPWQSRLSDQRTLLPTSTGSRTVYGRIFRNLTEYHGSETDPEDIARIMDSLGFDNIILLSQKMLTFGMFYRDDDLMTVLANAYVDYMLDNVVAPEEGIYAMIPVPFREPNEAVDLIDRTGDHPGIVAACMVTPGAEPPLGNRQYDVIYDACVDHDLPVVFHGGGAGLNEMKEKGYEKFIETHTIGFLMANIAQLVSVIVQGVPEKFPSLDLVFQESGLSWVPMITHRLDAEYLKRPSEAPLLEQLPSKYVAERCYFGTQPLEDTHPEYLEDTFKYLSPEHVMYASDYPHWDYDRPTAISDLPFLTDTEKSRILSGTAEEVFGL